MKPQDSEVSKKELEEYIEMIDSLIAKQSNEYEYWQEKKKSLIKRLEELDGT